jgi:Lactonase, 7-bladed beta-propeller
VVRIWQRHARFVVAAIFLIGSCIAVFLASPPNASAAEYLYLETPKGGIATYRIGANGSLTLTGSIAPEWPPNARFPSAPQVFLAVQPGGRFAYSSSLEGRSYLLQQYRVDQNTGVLSRASAPAAVPIRFQGPLEFSSSGDFLYINNVGSLRPYRVDPTTGQVTISGSGVAIPGSPLRTPIFTQSGRYAYDLRGQANNVASYQVSRGGSLKPTSSSLATTGAGADSLAVDPGGSFAYVANSRDDTISQYFIDPKSGTLLANPKNSTVSTVHDPGSLVIDASGRFLYGISAPNIAPLPLGHFAIFQYRIENDGQLKPVAEPLEVSRSVLNFNLMVTEPSGNFLYVPIGPNSKAVNPPSLLFGFRIQKDGRLKKLPFPGVPILDDTRPAVSWVGAKPIARLARRSVADLLEIKPHIWGMFRAVGPMVKKRNWHAVATVLPDGRVFFLESDEWHKTSGEIFDPKTGAFSVCKIPAGLSGGYVAAKLQSNRFLIRFPAENNGVSIFDARKMTLTPAGHLARKCDNIHWLLGDGRVLFHYTPGNGRFGPCGGEIYDPATHKSIPERSELESLNIMAQLGGDRLLVFPRPFTERPGALYGIPKSETVSVYDLASRRIRSIGDIPGRLAYHNEHLLLKDGRLLLVGTQQEGGLVELFDPKRMRFTSIGPLAQPHGLGLSLTLLRDGRVLISGGYGRTNAELFDPTTMTFTPTGPMVERNSTTGILLDNGTVLLAGHVFDGRGFSAGRSPRDGAEIYYPPKS